MPINFYEVCPVRHGRNICKVYSCLVMPKGPQKSVWPKQKILFGLILNEGKIVWTCLASWQVSQMKFVLITSRNMSGNNSFNLEIEICPNLSCYLIRSCWLVFLFFFVCMADIKVAATFTGKVYISLETKLIPIFLPISNSCMIHW